MSDDTPARFIALVLACGLAACGDDDADESSSDEPAATTTVAPADAIDIVMTENAFAVGGTLKPGGTIRLSNAGKEFHLMFVGKLKPGKTLAELTAVLTAPPPAEEGPTTTTAAAAAGGEATTTTAGADATTTTAGGETTTTAGGGGYNDRRGASRSRGRTPSLSSSTTSACRAPFKDRARRRRSLPPTSAPAPTP